MLKITTKIYGLLIEGKFYKWLTVNHQNQQTLQVSNLIIFIAILRSGFCTCIIFIGFWSYLLMACPTLSINANQAVAIAGVFGLTLIENYFLLVCNAISIFLGLWSFLRKDSLFFYNELNQVTAVLVDVCPILKKIHLSLVYNSNVTLSTLGNGPAKGFKFFDMPLNEAPIILIVNYLTLLASNLLQVYHSSSKILIYPSCLAKYFWISFQLNPTS